MDCAAYDGERAIVGWTTAPPASALNRRRARWRASDGRYARFVAPLDVFSPATRTWFERAFAEPTPAQALGWPAIARGGHVLIQAPTGSGKTLAAFLTGIDRLQATPGDGLRLLYVSPLKALNYDIERNLRSPLAGLESDLTVSVRTGDESTHLGLGLYVARLIATGHNGRIEARDIDGGVVFSVWLPAADARDGTTGSGKPGDDGRSRRRTGGARGGAGG